MTVERDIGGMKCGDVLAALPDFLLGELEPAQIALLQAHLAGCNVCENFGSVYAEAVAALRSLARPEPLADDVRDRFFEGLSGAMAADPERTSGDQ